MDESTLALLAAGMLVAAFVYASVGSAKPSMLQDFVRGRPSEIDVINGAVVREGARLGIPTPYNQALVLLVKAHEDIARGA